MKLKAIVVILCLLATLHSNSVWAQKCEIFNGVCRDRGYRYNTRYCETSCGFVGSRCRCRSSGILGKKSLSDLVSRLIDQLNNGSK